MINFECDDDDDDDVKINNKNFPNIFPENFSVNSKKICFLLFILKIYLFILIHHKALNKIVNQTIESILTRSKPVSFFIGHVFSKRKFSEINQNNILPDLYLTVIITVQIITTWVPD